MSESSIMRGLRAFAACTIVLAGILLPVPLTAAASPGQHIEDGTTAAATALVASLLGTGIVVSNVQYTGSPSSIGGFTGMDAVGIPSGVVMSSGYVETGGEGVSVVLGLNVSSGVSGIMGTAGDSDLDVIVAPEPTADAAVLEFDFVSTAAAVRFLYVFGSDEYNEYVGGRYNDVFAFYIDGVNCATVDTGSGVSVASINAINLGANSTLFNTNDADAGSPFDTEMDGFTAVLSCGGTVVPGTASHAKLALADSGDASFDTAVLFAAGSFAANNPPVALPGAHAGPIDEPIAFTLEATDPEGDALTYEVTSPPDQGVLSGTAPDLLFTPASGWAGTTTLSFRADDGTLTSAAADVTLTVSGAAAILPPTGVDPRGALAGACALLALGTSMRRRVRPVLTALP
jgi:hypothetical protein